MSEEAFALTFGFGHAKARSALPESPADSAGNRRHQVRAQIQVLAKSFILQAYDVLARPSHLVVPFFSSSDKLSAKERRSGLFHCF